ncbi:MAG: DUF4252 domain-containing protein [Melioribacteraceae bacterium]|nr:DUF4252 domain-containing protein [Melioribacteraceae bacterium]MCF8356058.1 DUF4252 domain-containing protein [Melioribacteraceae bacterium]MCF8394885.1 DUF4252 domain-containing protein [Melioribacteraceae bacterium]MCF8420418.1 DUF4252 domain-containing protein [Melioribacteraceae bacterium]
MKNLIKLSVIMLMLTAVLYAQKKDYSGEPGFIEFGDLTSLETTEMVTEVILEEHLLKMVSKLTTSEDMELSELIGGLKLIRVNAFEVNEENASKISDKVKEVDSKLMARNWDRIVRTRSNNESANVYIKTGADDSIVGLVVTAFDSNGEAAFVNIVGKIDLEAIGKLSQKFDIPSLQKVNGSKDSGNE